MKRIPAIPERLTEKLRRIQDRAPTTTEIKRNADVYRWPTEGQQHFLKFILSCVLVCEYNTYYFDHIPWFIILSFSRTKLLPQKSPSCILVLLICLFLYFDIYAILSNAQEH